MGKSYEFKIATLGHGNDGNYYTIDSRDILVRCTPNASTLTTRWLRARARTRPKLYQLEVTNTANGDFVTLNQGDIVMGYDDQYIYIMRTVAERR